MSLIIFLIILSALVIVHELGHFSVAKYFKVRVDEFGLGYPPKALKLFRAWNTDFTLNWLPFGGFVKIFGENPSDENGPTSENKAPDNFQSKNRGIQAAILAAGVIGNFLFAWILISLGFVSGLPSPGGALPIENPQTLVTVVVPGSPAAEAGIKTGDAFVALARGEEAIPAQGESLSPEAAAQFISSSPEPLTIMVKRGEEVMAKLVRPSETLLPGQPAIGVSMETIGTVKLPLYRAVGEGFKTSVDLTIATAQALGQFISQAVLGRADLSTVTGPVGMVGMVGDVRALGWSYILSFTALISINLSLINLLPFPALDGGRLLFVAIEAITRKRIPAKVFNGINAAGFALLIFLMILVTIHDVRNVL